MLSLIRETDNYVTCTKVSFKADVIEKVCGKPANVKVQIRVAELILT